MDSDHLRYIQFENEPWLVKRWEMKKTSSSPEFQGSFSPVTYRSLNMPYLNEERASYMNNPQFHNRTQFLRLPHNRHALDLPPRPAKQRKYNRNKKSEKVNPFSVNYLRPKEKRNRPTRKDFSKLYPCNSTMNKNQSRTRNSSPVRKANSGSVRVVPNNTSTLSAIKMGSMFKNNSKMSSFTKSGGETRVVVERVSNDDSINDPKINFYEQDQTQKVREKIISTHQVGAMFADDKTSFVIVPQATLEKTSILDDALDMEEQYNKLSENLDEDSSIHADLINMDVETLLDIYEVDVLDKFKDLGTI